MSKFLLSYSLHRKLIFLFFNLWIPKGTLKIDWNNLTVSTFPVLNQMSSRLVEVKPLELHAFPRFGGMRLGGWKKLRKKLLTPSSCLCVTQHLCPASSDALVRYYCQHCRCNFSTQSKTLLSFLYSVLSTLYLSARTACQWLHHHHINNVIQMLKFIISCLFDTY